jgi:hypothetical protein
MSSGKMSIRWPEIEAGRASCAPSSERAVASNSTDASPSRRKANVSVAAVARSSHCKSSIATTTGDASAA